MRHMTYDTEPEVQHVSENSLAEGDLYLSHGESVSCVNGGMGELPTLSGHVPSSHSHPHGNDGRHVEVRRPHPLRLIRQSHRPALLFILTAKMSVSLIVPYLTG